MLRKWDITNKEASQHCKEEIIARIEAQRDAQFGVLAAQEVIDIVAEYLGPVIYNRAIEDVKKAVQKKLADLEIDLDVLKS